MVTSRRRPPDEDERARGLIDNAVSASIRDWATMVDLASTDAGFDQFSNDVAGALRGCIHAHIASCSQDRENERSKRLRQKYLALQRRRIAALKKVDEAFAPKFPPLYHEYQAFMSGSHPSNYKEGLKALTDAMRLQADEWKLTAGRPPLRAFDALAEGLVVAYRCVTERTGVGFSAREGELRAFVEKVLPVARKIARAVTGKPLKVPENSEAIGEYLHRVALTK
jgi:hypothetical protein